MGVLISFFLLPTMRVPSSAREVWESVRVPPSSSGHRDEVALPVSLFAENGVGAVVAWGPSRSRLLVPFGGSGFVLGGFPK